MEDRYLTIAAASEGKIREKMSQFLSFAYPVKSRREAQEIIKAQTNRYHDARHVCWAYMLGPERKEWQLSDNGEPSGTAGKPILGQINSRELTDTLVVVVRYFGGIKLGTSGLIAAYRQAASEALDAAELKECFRTKEVAVRFPYQSANEVMKLVKGLGLEVAEQKFDNVCEMTLRLRESAVGQICGQLGKIGGLSFPEKG